MELDAIRSADVEPYGNVAAVPVANRAAQASAASALEQRVVEAALLNPVWGCQTLADNLKRSGMALSPQAVRDLLSRYRLVERCARLRRLEIMYEHEAHILTARQVRLLEKANPCFRERFLASSRPGEVLAQESFLVGRFDGLGNIYLHSVVDTFGSFAFAAVERTKRSDCAIALLRDTVLPFYAGRARPVGAVVTDNGREFCGTEAHHFAVFLADNGIEHYKAPGVRPAAHGFIERFHRTAIVEFFSLPARRCRYASIDVLRDELAAWVGHYNYERPHEGYRNFGKTPAALL